MPITKATQNVITPSIVTTDTRQTITGEKVIQCLYETTSTTTLSVGTGPKTLTVGTGLNWVAGSAVNIRRTSGIGSMNGTVTSYNPVTGVMVANITSDVGSGTYSAWTIVQNPGTSIPALRITANDSAAVFVVEDSTNPDPTPFTISASGRVGIGVTPDSTVCLALDSTGVKFNDGTIQTTAPTAAPTTDVQVFTSNGTWTKPNGARSVNVQLLGGGGGGGSGQIDLSAKGGNGGSGGGYLNLTIPASLLSSTESVVIGLGGTGGTGVVSGSGITGNNGGNTSCGTLIASGGLGGFQGSGSFQTPYGSLNSNAGGVRAQSGIGTGGAGNPATNISFALQGGAGGGAGGNIFDGSDYSGGSGGVSSVLNLSGGAGGASSGGNGGNGTTNSSAASGLFAAGGGGGGGGSNVAGGNGGSGGVGGFPASGGGGGGGTEPGTTSGAGGNGANGMAVITTYF